MLKIGIWDLQASYSNAVQLASLDLVSPHPKKFETLRGGEGVKKSENLADVIYGSPPTALAPSAPMPPLGVKRQPAKDLSKGCQGSDQNLGASLATSNLMGPEAETYTVGRPVIR